EPGAAGRARRAREPGLADERVDEARLADVRPADDGDLRQVLRRELLGLGRRDHEARVDLHLTGCTGAFGSNGVPVVRRAWQVAHSAARAAGVDTSVMPSASATGRSRMMSSSP